MKDSLNFPAPLTDYELAPSISPVKPPLSRVVTPEFGKAPQSRGSWVFRLLTLLLILSAYGLLQSRIHMPAYREDDPDAYYVLAQRLASGSPVGVVEKDDPFIHHAHMWVENARGEVLPKFAPGYPALMAVAYKLTGNDEAMFLVSPIMGGLTLLGGYFLFRCWVSAWAAVLGTAMLLFNSMFIFFADYPLAHATELCFVTWGMFFLWRWWRPVAMDLPSRSSITATPTPGTPDLVHAFPRFRHRILFGILAGLTLGYACAVRHTAALLVLPIVVVGVARLISDIRLRRLNVLAFILPAIAYAIFPLLMMGYNHRHFGSVWTTGYDLCEEQHHLATPELRTELFGFLINNISNQLRGLSYELGFFLFPLAMLGILFTGRATDRIVKLLWLLPPVIVYAAYYWTPSNQAYYRFLLPVIPLLIGSALLFIESVHLSRRKGFAIMVVMVGFMVLNNATTLANAVGIDLAQSPIGNAVALARSLGIDIKDRPEKLKEWPATSNRPDCAYLYRLTRLASENLNPNAVILARDDARYTPSSRRGFLVYPLSVFTQNYGSGLSRPRWRDTPKMQPSRLQRFIKFYQERSGDALFAEQMNLIHAHLKAGRQVAFLVDQGTGRRLENEYARWFDIKETATAEGWGIYDVKEKAPTTRPAE